MGSKSSVTSINDNHANQANIQGGLSAVQGDGNYTTINTLDGGAVAGVLDLAKVTYQAGMTASSQNLGQIVGGLFSWAKDANNQAVNLMESQKDANTKLQSTLANAYATANDKPQVNINMVIVLVVVAGAVYAIFKGKKA